MGQLRSEGFSQHLEMWRHVQMQSHGYDRTEGVSQSKYHRSMIGGSTWHRWVLPMALWIAIGACSAERTDDAEVFSLSPQPTPTWEMPLSPPLQHNQPALPTLESELRSAYASRYLSYWECLRSPMDCEDGYLLPGGPAGQHMAAVRTELTARDRFVGTEAVGYHVIEEIRFAPDRLSAEVTACWWSTAVLYGAPKIPDVPTGPSNPATLVTSTPEGGRQRDRFVYIGGQWLLHSSQALDNGFGIDPCGG